ncbi:hypothetical protein Ciccas_009084 [Cichlidogyrus casuarinus]|uniref:Thioredoxin-like protein 4A n=1 Tax=Cichlidogyrus casuarinus TaxID=1844966 RepID=A0ABD2Q0U2_9PLAT
MSYLMPHLYNGYQVDQAILSEETRLVIIRFGSDADSTCMVMDETLAKIAPLVKKFAVIYLVDIKQVPDFNKMYELYDPCTVMFFYRNKHMMIDLGTGNNNKVNWAIENKQELIDIIEVIYRAACKGEDKLGTVLTDDDRHRIAQLFEKLDVDSNGKVSLSELKQLIKGSQISQHNDAKEVLRKGKETQLVTDDDSLSLAEFINYIQDTETHLKLAFSKLDHDKNQVIDPQEIQSAMAELGLKVSLDQAKHIMKQMDKDGSLNIDFNEWRDYLLFSGSRDLKDIFRYIRRSYAFDLGDNALLWDDFSEEEKNSGEALKTLIAGGLAGCVSRTATAPLDRIKVVWQALGQKAASGGVLGSVQTMLKEGGFVSMWRGNGVSCIKIAPESAVKFQAYEYFKTVLINREGRQSLSPQVTMREKFAAGAGAGAFSQTVIYPMEVVKTRMCLGKTGEFSSIFDCARKLLQEQGPRIFFRGYVPNILGILPYAGIDLALFETFKTQYVNHPAAYSQGSAPVYVSLVSGALSSVIAQITTYPLALARTKMQANKHNPKEGFISVLKNIHKKEGIRGLYSGIGPNMLKVIPAVSISYACYDQLRYYLGVSRQ